MARSPIKQELPAPPAVAEWAATKLETGFLLTEVSRLLRATLDQRVRAIGLTGAAWRVVIYLWKEGGLTQAGLAQRLEVSPMALGQMVDRLELSGHVERRIDPKDRRKWRLHLTEKSRAAMPTFLAAGQALEQESFSDFGDAEIESLRLTLSRLRTRLHEMKIDELADDMDDGGQS